MSESEEILEAELRVTKKLAKQNLNEMVAEIARLRRANAGLAEVVELALPFVQHTFESPQRTKVLAKIAALRSATETKGEPT